MSATPGTWATRPGDAPPSLDTKADDRRVTLSARVPAVVASTGARSVVLTGSAVAQWPSAGRTQQDVTVPTGWTAHPAARTKTVHSNGLPVGIDAPVTVGVPAGVPSGRYPVTFRFRARGRPREP